MEAMRLDTVKTLERRAAPGMQVRGRSTLRFTNTSEEDPDSAAFLFLRRWRLLVVARMELRGDST